jgi:hypothetical protein
VYISHGAIVGVGVAVGVGVGVAVGVGVLVGVLVAVGVLVGVFVGLGVKVGTIASGPPAKVCPDTSLEALNATSAIVSQSNFITLPKKTSP